MLTPEHITIESGRSWKEITNTSFSYSIQNTTDVRVEYSFIDNASISRGFFLNPSDYIEDLQQSVYVRLYETEQNGTLAILRNDSEYSYKPSNGGNVKLGRNDLSIGAFGHQKDHTR